MVNYQRLTLSFSIVYVNINKNIGKQQLLYGGIFFRLTVIDFLLLHNQKKKIILINRQKSDKCTQHKT